MTTERNVAAFPAPWTAGASYLYLLDLDGQSLAWEYLRRHPSYRAVWRSGGLRGAHGHEAARRWGLRSCR